VPLPSPFPKFPQASGHSPIPSHAIPHHFQKFTSWSPPGHCCQQLFCYLLVIHRPANTQETNWHIQTGEVSMGGGVYPTHIPCEVFTKSALGYCSPFDNTMYHRCHIMGPICVCICLQTIVRSATSTILGALPALPMWFHLFGTKIARIIRITLAHIKFYSSSNPIYIVKAPSAFVT